METASTVSRSTRSRRYTINTSLIGENLNNNFSPIGEGHSDESYKDLISRFSLDIGRCDYKRRWMSIWSLAIFPIFQILTSIGSDLYDYDKNSATINSIMNVFRYITEIIPTDNDILTILMINLFITFLYIAYVIFFIYTLYSYSGNAFPSTGHLMAWIFISRCIVPIITTYLSFLTCKGLRLLLSNGEPSIIAVHFAFGLPLLILHLIFAYTANNIWQATPIFRKNDLTQLWFCYSNHNLKSYFVIIFNVFCAQLGAMIGGIAGKVVFSVLVIILYAFVLFLFIRDLPYVQPVPNALLISIFLESLVLALNPILAHFLVDYYTIILIIDIVLFILFIFVGRWIVSGRLYHVYGSFEYLHYEPQEEEEEKNDYLGLIQPQKPKAPVDYTQLGDLSVAETSLFMRVGYMYNIEDINDLGFVKYAVAQFSAPEIVFSAAQIAYAVQTNLIYIGEIQKVCQTTSNNLHNSSQFITILNELRQELLTQLNKPLLEAIHAAKKSNSILQGIIGDFWGALLKQKIDAMHNTIPQISSEMDKTVRLYQRLTRNYTSSPIVYRETVNFYHKSIGDHVKTVEFQKIFNAKTKKNGDENESESTSTTNETFESGTADKAFQQRIEPSISAQNALESMNSQPSCFFTFVFILSFLVLIICPIIVLCFGLIDMNSFSNTFEPVRVFSTSLYDVTRLPQLVRRRQLELQGKIMEHKEEVGPVRGINSEFNPAENIIPSITQYTNDLRSLSVSILSSCSANSEIESLCSDKLYDRTTGSTTSKASSYDILSSFVNAAEKLLDLTDDEWLNVDKNSDALFLFDNFDVLVTSIKNIISFTNQQVIARKDEFSTKALILYIVTWAVPIVIIVPFTFFTLRAMNAELTFMLKLFLCFPKNEISTLRWSMKSNHQKSKGHDKVQRNNFSSESTMSASEANNELAEQVTDSLAASSRIDTGMYTPYIESMIVFGLISCVLTTAGVAIYESSMLNILNVAYGYVMAVDSTASAVASYVWSQEVFSNSPIENIDIITLKAKSLNYVTSLSEIFDNFLYGTEEGGMKAGLLLGSDVITSYFTSTSVNSVNDDYAPSNGFLHSVYFSLSCDSQLRMLTESSAFIMNTSTNEHYSFDDDFVYHYEHLIFSHLDYCLSAGQDLILGKTNTIESSQINQMLLLFLSLFTIQILFYFTVNLILFIRARHHHRTVRRLLLLIPPEALLKGQLIIKWLSGTINYRTYNRNRDAGKANTGTNICQEFIVNNSKGGLILTDVDLKVTLVNSTICSMFKSSDADLIGQNFINVLQSQIIDKEKANVIRLFEHDVTKMKNGRARSNQFVINTSILGSNNQLMYISATVIGHSEDGEDYESGEDGVMTPATSFSIIVQDRTSEHFQEALVASEKAKGEKLIESLLPPSIIKRMNDGETDITFEVQQATCLFTSIVGWSDLTKNMSAMQVVSLLNNLFCAYDEELHNYPAITKMKTIGHIYMCCGGLFSDSSVNSAQVVVDYAVKLLEIAAKVSKDIGISFQITCGVNTGGPVKCGILGVTRPVFDIIGDVVNVSSRMNSHCLPGYVQVSPTTYDAIKFLQFNIKERGEIQVKGKGMLKTYLVSPSNNTH